jgi:hypothetical protein
MIGVAYVNSVVTPILLCVLSIQPYTPPLATRKTIAHSLPPAPLLRLTTQSESDVLTCPSHQDIKHYQTRRSYGPLPVMMFTYELLALVTALH